MDLSTFERALMGRLHPLTWCFVASLAHDLTKELERHISITAVFTTLERLEDRGLVESNVGKDGWDREREMFRLTQKGKVERLTHVSPQPAASIGLVPKAI